MTRKSDIALLCSSIFISLALVEIFLRLFQFGYNNAPLNPSPTSHHEHPRNYEFTSYSPSGEWGNFLIKTDEYGNRKLDGICQISEGSNRNNIFILGDSFVEAFQVTDQQTFSGIIQKEVCSQNIVVSNFGVSSYSPLLSYIHFREYLKNIPKKHSILKNSIVIHVLYENDYSGDMDYFKEASSDENGNIIVPSSSQLSWLQVLNRNFYISRLVTRFYSTILEGNRRNNTEGVKSENHRLTFNSSKKTCSLKEEEISTTRRFVEALNAMVKKNQGTYFLTSIPGDLRKEFTENYKCTEKIARDLNIPYIKPSRNLIKNPEEYYFLKDIHLNSKGHFIVGNTILEFITIKKSSFKK